MASEFEEKLTVRERRSILAYAASGVALGGLGLFLAAALLGRLGGASLACQVAIIGIVLRVALSRQLIWPTRTERRVRARSTGLAIDNTVIRRATITDGLYVPATAETWASVRFFAKRRRPLLEVEVENEGQARSLLRALGLDAASRRAEFRVTSPLRATRRKNIVFGALLLFFFIGVRLLSHMMPADLVVPLLFGGVLPIVALMSWPAQITIGVDGILHRWLWKKRFIALRDIAEVQPEADRSIRLRLVSGETEIIHAAAPDRRETSRAERHRDTILARIVDALTAHRERGPGADVAMLVGRGSRTREEWKKALADLARAEAGYRQTAVRDEDLWRVMEDPRAAEDARAGAAILLRRSLDAQGKARIRVAAEATASPKLRIALDAAVADSDEAIDLALAELAPDDRKTNVA